MASHLSVIVLATGADRLLRRAAASLAAQALAPVELIVVHDSRDEAAARRRLEAAELPPAQAVVTAPAPGPGAARNAGVRACRGECVVVLDGSERLDPGYFQAAILALEHDPSAAFATTSPRHAPSAGAPRPAGERVTAADLAAGPWEAAAATVIRRDRWEAAGGFDETLDGLVDWELLLRLVGRGAPGVWLAAGQAARDDRDDPLLRAALRPERHLPSMRRILEAHAPLFAREAAAALCGRDRALKALWARGDEAAGRHAAARAELEGLAGELRRLRGELQARGLDASEWDDLRRTVPASRNWGLERGRPIDRHYIEGFVEAHADDVRGAVLEVLDDGLTRRYGGSRVERSDVLDIDVDNPRATIHGDLRDAHRIPGDTYDCFILTQTLHVIDDIDRALAEARRVLKPGGVLLATLPCLSMLAPDGGPASDYWRVTPAGARVLFGKAFPPRGLEVRGRGNVLAATAFLHGLSCDEVEARELDEDDPDYPVIVTVRAVKEGARTPRPRREEPRAAILLYHRVAAAAHDVHRLAIPPETLRSQLESLARAWDLVPLPVLAAACASGAPPDRSIALTFDDGYLDNLEHALPPLEELRVPATFFLTGERPGEAIRYWWDVLEDVLLADGPWPASLALRVDGVRQAFGCGDAGERRASHDRLYAILKASPPAVRDHLVRQLLDAAGTKERPLPRRMSGEEARRLAASPLVEIGAHGLHHLSLSSLSRDDVHREVFEGRSAVEAICGRRVAAFAYPYGEVSPDSAEIAAAAGFSCAVTCEARGLRARERPHRLPRLQAEACSGADLAAWLEGGLGCE